MPRYRTAYPPEFRRQRVDLVRSGRTPEELARLRRENHRLRQERDILAKAAAWFARESKASPNGFTGS